MREIKFRAWDGEKMVCPDYITRSGIGYWEENSIPTQSDIIMQFTGLPDKNGKEIYEGDIVNWNNEPFNMEVSFESIKLNGMNVSGFCAKTTGGRYFWFSNPTAPLDELEKVGNIFQNPDIIK